MSTVLSRKEISVAICAVLGFLMIAQYYVDIPAISSIANYCQIFATSIASFMMIFGTTSLILFNYGHVKKKTPGQWFMSAWAIFLIVSISAIGLTLGPNQLYFKWMFENVFINLDTAMYSVLGFYVLSAAWRAYRARNLDATFLLVSGILAALVNAPVGEFIFGSGVISLGNWVVNVPTIAGLRTTYFGVALGSIYVALRTFIGKESGVLGISEEKG